MKISLEWLKTFVDFNPDITPETLRWRVTESSAEIEEIISIGAGLEQVVVGKINSISAHPNTDALSLAQVDVGGEKILQIVFKNSISVQEGDLIPTAIAPCNLGSKEISSTEVKGILSEGMLCLNNELVEGLRPDLTRFPINAIVGTPITEYLPVQDTVFHVDNHSITHRPDLFSHIGFARECVALDLAKWKTKTKTVSKQDFSGSKKIPFEVSFDQEDFSYQYHAGVVEGVDDRPAPLYIQMRLLACGIRSLNAVVDITNFVMLELGAPLHSFDLDALAGHSFHFRLSRENEEMTTLDGQKHSLPEGLLIAENNNDIVDLVGVMGGENSQFTASTRKVYFHQGIYNPQYIRKSMLALGHRTDAGTIYEKGPSPSISEEGLLRALELTREIFPDAQFPSEILAIKPVNAQQEVKRVVILRHQDLESYYGDVFDSKDALDILEKLGFSTQFSDNSYTVEVPRWRENGVSMPADLIEEIIRIYGFSSIKGQSPLIDAKMFNLPAHKQLQREIQDVMVLLGFQEEINFSFFSEKHLELIPGINKEEIIEIFNPVNDELKLMRPSLLPGMLYNSKRNWLRYKSIQKTFECGRIFSVDKKTSDSSVLQPLQLMVMVTSVSDDGFLTLKQAVITLLEQLGVSYEFKVANFSNAYPHRSLEIVSEGQRIAKIYRVHQRVLDETKHKGQVYVFECLIQNLLDLPRSKNKYQSINKNPSAHLDLSIVVDKDILYQDISQQIKSVSLDFSVEIKLVDVYSGEHLEADKKSFTVALTLQHPDRTLGEEEIQNFLNQAINVVEKNGALVRR